MTPFSAVALFSFTVAVLAIPSPITPDPNGAKNVGNGQGLQFITGACSSTADCSQSSVESCCAFISGDSSTGICSGIAVSNAIGKAGCGFGDGNTEASTNTTDSAAISSIVSAAPAATSSINTGNCSVDSSLAGNQSVGKGTASQFITGQCFSKADCASNCCVAQSDGLALCKAELVTTEAGLSCDFSCTP